MLCSSDYYSPDFSPLSLTLFHYGYINCRPVVGILKTKPSQIVHSYQKLTILQARLYWSKIITRRLQMLLQGGIYGSNITILLVLTLYNIVYKRTIISNDAQYRIYWKRLTIHWRIYSDNFHVWYEISCIIVVVPNHSIFNMCILKMELVYCNCSEKNEIEEKNSL